MRPLSLKKNIIALSLGLFVALTMGCATYEKPIDRGYIDTEGVEIRAMDDSFVLRAGEPWKSPFQSEMLLDHQIAFYESGEGVIGKYNFALEKLGAKKVMVKVPYLEKELYGVLSLNQAIVGCEGVVTRSYQINIPESYVQQALNGQVSVLYEYYPCEGYPEIKSWILWLSDVPF